MRALVVSAVIIAGVLSSAPAASAGKWAVLSCSQPGGASAPTEGWSTSATGAIGPYSGTINTCAEGGGLTARTSGEAPQSAYQGPQWVFSTPAGSMIAGGNITATLTAPHGQSWLATPQASYVSADVLANCQFNLPCGSAGTLTAAIPITHTGGTHLYATAVCVGEHEGENTCPAHGGTDAAITITAADIQLANDATPTASNLSGALLQDNPARGTQPLTFTASEPEGPGVRTITIQLDEKTVYSGTPETNGGLCAPVSEQESIPAYTSLQPCKQTQAIDLPVDTTAVADGRHTLKITLTDAAGNSAVVYDNTITTDNAPENTSAPTISDPSQPQTGETLTARPGEWATPQGAGAASYTYQWQDCNSAGNECTSIAGASSTSYTPASSDIAHTLRVRVSAADSDGSASQESEPTPAITAPPTRAPAASPGPNLSSPAPGAGILGASASLPAAVPNGTPTSESAQLKLTNNALIGRSYAKRALALTGTLATTSGWPIAGATLQVSEQAAGSAVARIIANGKTAANGTFAIHVPAGPSRTITVGYRAYSTDATYAAQASVHETVTAGVGLRITPHSTTSTGTITLTGQVAGPIPKGGITIELLVRYHHQWQPFRDPHTNSRGQFRIRYRFQGAEGRFPFRAQALPGQTGFPYARGDSNTITITTG